MNPLVAQVVLAVYAVLLLVGGVMGFVKAASRPSLIAGAASALLAGLAAVVVGYNLRLGALQGALVAVVLAVFFGGRFRKTRKWMPAGLMMVLSEIVAVYLLIAAAATWAAPAA